MPDWKQSLREERLRNQKLYGPQLRRPEDVVTWLGAVQAQDYPGAAWALSLRTKDLSDAAVERAFNAGRILRTHALRPTWHFLAPADIRWVLALTAPRVRTCLGSYDRQLAIDERLRSRSRAVFERALSGGKYLTRTELGAALGASGIDARGPRLAHLVMHAELDAVICSGPRQGRQFTYALLDERVKPAPALTRDAALAELATRYFSSHGPATLRDYVWWSGLTVSDARAGIALAGLSEREVDARKHWLAGRRHRPPAARPTPTCHLLPNYDEYLIAYKDRAAVADRLSNQGVFTAFPHLLVIDGMVAGAWKRSIGPGRALVQVRAGRRLAAAERRAIAGEAARYGVFLGLPVTLSVE